MPPAFISDLAFSLSVVDTAGTSPTCLSRRRCLLSACTTVVSGHRHSRNDSSASASSVALSYALHGAAGKRVAWARHRQDRPFIGLSDERLLSCEARSPRHW